MMPIETLNVWADKWATFMWSSLLDTTVILAVVATIWIALRRWMPAQLGYCLFFLVLIKLCVPIHVTVPGAAAYLSPQHAIERLSAWTMLSPQQASANRMSDGSKAEDDVMPEEMLGMMSAADGKHSETAAAPRLSIAAKLMCAWSMTVLVLSVWFTWAQARLARVLREARPFERGSLPIDLPELKRLAGVAQPVRLLSSAAVSSPAIGGLFRPSIVLPAGLAGTLSAQQIRWVLLHELAHIRRHDLWVAALQRLVQITQFFNPAIWLANRMIDQQREYACDDAALAASATSRRECGAAFLSILDRANAQPARLTPALGIFSAKHSFRRRLMRILDNNRPVRTRFTVGSMAVLLALAVLLLPRLQATQQSSSEGASENNTSIVQPAFAEPEAETNAPADEDTENEDAAQSQPDNEEEAAIEPDTDADHEAEAALKDLGARIFRNDDGEVVAFDFPFRRRGFTGQLTDDDLVHVKKLNWSKTRSTHTTRSGMTLAQPRFLARQTEITDAGLVHLKELTQLRTVNLWSCKGITDAGLVHLKGLTELEFLGLSGTNISDAGLVNLKGLTKLEFLGLSSTKISDAGLVHLKRLTSLKTLYLFGTQISDAGLDHLKGLNSLNRLELAGTKISDAGLVHLKGLTSLKRLGLDSTDVSGAGLVHLKGLTDLDSLDLTDTDITDEGLVHLKGLTDLGGIDLTDTDITDEGLVHLKGLTDLGGIGLTDTDITDEGLVHLKGLTSLETLWLKGTKISDAGLVHLKGLASLKTLGLDGTDVSDAGLVHLKGLKKLKKVNLQNTKVSQEGFDKLKQALPKCKIEYP